MFPPDRAASSVGHWVMDRSFFEEIGALDAGMEFWGGENVDLAIRVSAQSGHITRCTCTVFLKVV